jgi:translation initiation factor IF-1
VGFDAAVGKSVERTLEAVVVEQLPQLTYRVRLENNDRVLAHAAGAAITNFVRLRPGDRVRVVLSPHDPGRGRIVEILNKE